MFSDEESAWGGSLALPDRTGWTAILHVEEQRCRRHGGNHGLVLIRLDPAAEPAAAGLAAAALSNGIRDVDFLARIDLDTFAVLALHCDDLGAVVRRLREGLDSAGVSTTTLIDARPAGPNLRAVWAAMVADAPTTRDRRHADFTVSFPPSLN